MDPTQYPSLRTRLAIVLILLAALFGAGISSILFINFRNELRSELRHRLENITALAGLQQNGDDFEQIQSRGDEFFNRVHEQNVKIKRTDPELRFVYTMRKNELGNIYFVVDARLTPDETKISNYGDFYQEPSDLLTANFDTMTATIVEPDFYTDEFDTLISAYTPIYNSRGEKVGVLGVDILANTILVQEREFLFRLVGIYLGSILLLAIGSLVFANYLARPIISLRDMANKISQGDFSTRISDIPHTRELAELAVDLNSMTTNLSGLINDLEQKVAERTAGLTKNTEQLRAASYIARQTADVQDLGSILELVVNLITDQFDFYHAGIFLINETGEEAVLQAASSEGGKRMLARGHALMVGSQGIVGYVASQKRPRIALDVGTDAVFFNNPDLPMTRSEVALPLVVRNRVLGVLDIQSDQPQAFSPEDLDILQTLADQVAVAIDNARLLGEAQAALMQLEAVSALRTREAWTSKLQEQPRVYTYTPLGLRAEIPASEADETRVKVPIALRGQQIGAISLAKKDASSLTHLDEDLINEVASQVGLAVDNLRLLEDAQQRARQEQTIGELATRFSQAMDIDSLLQTAARELGQMPDVSEVSVYIGQLPEQIPQRRRGKRQAG